jgi:hypothetical protein
MPSLINRVPPGLLSLLGTKAMGINPSVLPDTVQPIVDTTQAYLGAFAERLQVDTSAVTARAVLGSSGQLAPGVGEIFAVNSCIAFAQVAAASTLRMRLVLFDVGTGNVFAAAPASASAAASEWAICSWDGPLYIPTGFELGVAVESFSGAPGTIRLGSIFTRLKV